MFRNKSRYTLSIGANSKIQIQEAGNTHELARRESRYTLSIGANAEIQKYKYRKQKIHMN